MTPEDACKIYETELRHQTERRGWPLPIPIGSRSEADYAEVCGLYARHGYNPDDLAALLVYASEKAVPRGMDYVLRTVRNALGDRHALIGLLPEVLRSNCDVHARA